MTLKKKFDRTNNSSLKTFYWIGVSAETFSLVAGGAFGGGDYWREMSNFLASTWFEVIGRGIQKERDMFKW